MALENKENNLDNPNRSNYQKQNIDNLNMMLKDIKEGNISNEKLQHIVDYIFDLSEIESIYDTEKNEIKSFLKSSLQGKLSNSLSKYNVSNFDVDGQKGLDDIEQENYKRTIQDIIGKIMALGGLKKFLKIHKDIDLDNGVDLYISNAIKLDKHILGEKGTKNFVEEKFQQYTMMTENDLNDIKNKQFDITSRQSWGDLSMLFFKEFGDGAEDVLRFLLNIPSGALLIPRYTKYRIDLNSEDLQESTEAEIRINELVTQNPSLMLIELLGEKGIILLKQLSEMLLSGKQGDIATLMVTIMGLLAGGAGVTKMGLNMYRSNLVKSARIAGKESRMAGKTSSRLARNNIKTTSSKIGKVEEKLSGIDDIVGGAGVSYLFKFGRQLTKTEEVNRVLYFDNGFEGTLRQGDVGTCYFLASYEMMKTTREGKINLLNMIEKIDNNGEVSYSIKFPGFEKNMIVSQKEIDLVNSKGYGLKSGSLGDHIVSVAHMKYIYETKSEAFLTKNISFQDYIKNHKRQRYADMIFESGQEENAIKLLMGKENVIVDYFYISNDGLGFNHGEMFLPPKGLQKTSNKISYDQLSNFFEEGAMIGVGTKRKKTPGITSERELGVEYDDFNGNKVTILGPHAYWVKNIDIKNGFVELSEPFQSTKIIKFKLEQFSKIFNSVTLIRKRK
ncbi:MAG: hypothetical protein PHN31_04010 [Candidatus Gracilibacteria bacterium]|nr:hypothetical protein [Candidatus Gracilibacteria bacterium]